MDSRDPQRDRVCVGESGYVAEVFQYLDAFFGFGKEGYGIFFGGGIGSKFLRNFYGRCEEMLKELYIMNSKTEINMYGGVGVCPLCGSEDIKYGNPTPDNSEMYFDGVCSKCGAKFREYYSVEYSRKSHIFDSNDRFVDRDIE